MQQPTTSTASQITTTNLISRIAPGMSKDSGQQFEVIDEQLEAIFANYEQVVTTGTRHRLAVVTNPSLLNALISAQPEAAADTVATSNQLTAIADWVRPLLSELLVELEDRHQSYTGATSIDHLHHGIGTPALEWFNLIHWSAQAKNSLLHPQTIALIEACPNHYFQNMNSNLIAELGQLLMTEIEHQTKDNPLAFIAYLEKISHSWELASIVKYTYCSPWLKKKVTIAITPTLNNQTPSDQLRTPVVECTKKLLLLAEKLNLNLDESVKENAETLNQARADIDLNRYSATKPDFGLERLYHMSVLASAAKVESPDKLAELYSPQDQADDLEVLHSHLNGEPNLNKLDLSPPQILAMTKWLNQRSWKHVPYSERDQLVIKHQLQTSCELAVVDAAAASTNHLNLTKAVATIPGLLVEIGIFDPNYRNPNFHQIICAAQGQRTALEVERLRRQQISREELERLIKADYQKLPQNCLEQLTSLAQTLASKST